MKADGILLIAAFLIILFCSLSFPFETIAQEHTCRIKAGLDNIHVYVRDFDRDGNPTKRVIYRGWILRGRSIIVRSYSGHIEITFKADSAKRGSGNNQTSCRGNKTITLP